MDIKSVYELLERFERTSVSELELELEGMHIHLKRPESEMTYIPSQQDKEKEVSIRKIPEDSKKTLKAPLAGTFYCAPSPEAEPFVRKGQKVHAGEVIGIIEAMKLMNEVTIEEDGVIDEIMAKDGTLVAYDEVLIRYV